MITQFPELDAILVDHSAAVRRILGEQFIGFYLQGSFALGGADEQSDADFMVVTTIPPSGEIEEQLRSLHDEIPQRLGIWNKNLEGSYANVESLRSLSGVGVNWLYADRGHRELTWTNHDSTPHTRWILRNCGITIDGPPIAELIDEVPQEAMRREAKQSLLSLLDSIREWANMDNAWTQRYIVQTYCRVLYTLQTGGVASKPAALEWGKQELNEVWKPLLTQVAEDRKLPWNPVDPPRPGSMTRALEFAVYVETIALETH